LSGCLETSFYYTFEQVTPPRSMSDTRPIANISHLAKVFERIVANQIIDHLETNNILDDHQSGFRKFHSTQAALLSLTDDIRKAIDSDELTYLLLFDFTKAFDYVNPKVLFITMYEMGFTIEVIYNCDLPSIIIDGNVIPYVNTTKHLGIHVTRNLSWDVHVAHTTRKVYATLNCLKYRRNILSTPTRKLLVMSTIIPIIEYCS
ncbi:GSCOCG00010276001-RA-CDS, partial [Cotesia congregata]